MTRVLQLLRCGFSFGFVWSLGLAFGFSIWFLAFEFGSGFDFGFGFFWLDFFSVA